MVAQRANPASLPFAGMTACGGSSLPATQPMRVASELGDRRLRRGSAPSPPRRPCLGALAGILAGRWRADAPQRIEMAQQLGLAGLDLLRLPFPLVAHRLVERGDGR